MAKCFKSALAIILSASFILLSAGTAFAAQTEKSQTGLVITATPEPTDTPAPTIAPTPIPYLTSSDTNIVVDQTAMKISYCNFAKDGVDYVDLTNIKNSLFPLSGCTFEMYQADGITVATAMDVMNRVTVSQNGVPVATYTFIATVLYGDVNGDGNITFADLTINKRYEIRPVTYQFPKAFSMVAADVNKSGSISIADITVLLRYILNPTAYPIRPPVTFVYDAILGLVQ